MARVLFIIIFTFSVLMSAGQSQYLLEYSVRDSLIDDAMNAEDYTLAIGLMDQQFELIKKYTLYDSLYHYCYHYGRAQWRGNSAEEGLKQAIVISNMVKEKDDNILHYLQTINDLSWLYYETGRVSECLRNDSIYLAICLQHDSIPADLISIAYYNLGYDYMEVGKYAKSLVQFQKSIDVILQSNDSLDDRLSMSYNALGAMQWRLGEMEAAIKSYEESLALIEDYTDPKSQLEKGNILGNIALVLQDNGQLIEAMKYQEEFIRIDSEALPYIEDVYLKETALRRLSSAYINLADIYFGFGDYEKSRNLIELAVAERERLLEPDDPSLVAAIEHLAYLEMQSGNYPEAEVKLRDYLDYCRKYFGNESALTAWALKGLGTLYSLTGDFERADNLFTEAIESQKAAGNEASDPALALIYRERAKHYVNMNKPQAALADFQKSMQLYSYSRDENNGVIIGIYLDMADVRIANNDFERAQKDVQDAFRLIHENESVIRQSPYLLPEAHYLNAQIKVKGKKDNESKISAMEDLEVAINLLKANKQTYLDEESKLLFYESHRRIFDLAEAVAFHLYTNTNDPLWIEAFYRVTEESRTILLRNRLQNFSALDFAGVPDSLLIVERKLTAQLRNEESDAEAVKAVVDIERQYDSLLDYFSKYYPEYYALKYADKNYSLTDIQKILLDDRSSILIYSLTSDFAYALLVNKHDAQLLRLHDEELRQNIMRMNKAIVDGDKQKYELLGKNFYEQLVEPLQPSIAGDELFIVPDEDLFFLNFEILPIGKDSSDTDEQKLLIHDYTISYLLSTTVSMQFTGLQTDKSNQLLSFAPGFSDRQKIGYQQSVADSSRLDKKFLSYIQQPFAVQTARQVAGIFSGAAFLDEEADETTFKKESGKYGVIHLGTHAEVNENAPLMSHLVLSKNKQNDSIDDGYLHAYEIYQMPLRAELAVLTACETGVGKQRNSEGVISLAHSFTYAGCPSIVMSLWNIDEKTSSSIIRDFYHYLSLGVAKNIALRKAKLNYLSSAPPELQSPYYWAGLVLLGDESPVQIEKPNTLKRPFLVFIFLIILLSGILYRRK